MHNRLGIISICVLLYDHGILASLHILELVHQYQTNIHTAQTVPGFWL